MISIYKLYSPSNPHLIYIGSTQQLINDRKRSHKNDAKSFIHHGNKFRSGCRLIMKDDCEIIELEKCEKKDREKREQIYMIIAKLMYKKNCINYRWAIPLSDSFHTRRYMEKRLLDDPIAFKKWKSDNDKKYREGPKRESILERKKLYHSNNKEEINRKRRERAKQKILCECGRKVSISSMGRHLKSKNHNLNI